MKFPLTLLILILFATDYASAYRRDGLGTPRSDYADVESHQALDLTAHTILEETTYGSDPERATDIDATTINPKLEYSHGFDLLEKAEKELNETPVPRSDEPERNVRTVARRLRRLIVPTVETRFNSDEKESLRDVTIPLVSCYCLTTYES